MTDILDAKYSKADLRKIVEEATHLNDKEREQLYKTFKKNEDLFDKPLGTFTGEPYDIKLKENAEPFHTRPFPVPHTRVYLQIGTRPSVLKRVIRSQWGAPTFIIPKKDGTVRFISDFRELNKRIKRQPYPIPKIQDLLLRQEGF